MRGPRGYVPITAYARPRGRRRSTTSSWQTSVKNKANQVTGLLRGRFSSRHEPDETSMPDELQELQMLLQNARKNLQREADSSSNLLLETPFSGQATVLKSISSTPTPSQSPLPAPPPSIIITDAASPDSLKYKHPNFLYLYSTPFTLTMPSIRHGPIRFNKEDLCRPADAMVDSATSRGDGCDVEFSYGSLDATISFIDEEEQVDELVSWLVSLGLSLGGLETAVVPPTAPSSHSGRGKEDCDTESNTRSMRLGGSAQDMMQISSSFMVTRSSFYRDAGGCSVDSGLFLASSIMGFWQG